LKGSGEIFSPLISEDASFSSSPSRLPRFGALSLGKNTSHFFLRAYLYYGFPFCSFSLSFLLRMASRFQPPSQEGGPPLTNKSIAPPPFAITGGDWFFLPLVSSNRTDRYSKNPPPPPFFPRGRGGPFFFFSGPRSFFPDEER